MKRIYHFLVSFCFCLLGLEAWGSGFQLRHEGVYKSDDEIRPPMVFVDEKNDSSIIDADDRSLLVELNGSGNVRPVSAVDREARINGRVSQNGMMSASVERSQSNSRDLNMVLKNRLQPEKICRIPISYFDYPDYRDYRMTLFEIVNQGKSALITHPNSLGSVRPAYLFTMNDDGSCSSSATSLGKHSNKLVFSRNQKMLAVSGERIVGGSGENGVTLWDFSTGQIKSSKLPAGWKIDKFSEDESGLYLTRDGGSTLDTEGFVLLSDLSNPIVEVKDFLDIGEKIFDGIIPKPNFDSRRTITVAENSYANLTAMAYQQIANFYAPKDNRGYDGYIGITYRSSLAVQDDKLLTYIKNPKLPFGNCVATLANSGGFFVDKKSSTIVMLMNAKDELNYGVCDAPYTHIVKAYDFSGKQKYELNSNGSVSHIDFPVFKTLNNEKDFLFRMSDKICLVETSTGNMSDCIAFNWATDRLMLTESNKYLVVRKKEPGYKNWKINIFELPHP